MDPFAVLPWELARECLLRVPYHSHANLKVVCKTWEAVVKDPQFYEDRKKLKTSEQLICSLELGEYLDDTTYTPELVVSVFDPLRGTQKTLPRLSHFTGSHGGLPFYSECVCVNQKLVLLGGWIPSRLTEDEALKTVFIFDLSSSRWSCGADMPVSRICCACSVSPQGLIYVAGGDDENGNALRSAGVYNVFLDEWKLLPDMNREMEAGCYSVFIHGNFFAIWRDLNGWSAEVYDPETGVWTTLEMGVIGPEKGPGACLLVSSSGRLFSIEKHQGVMEYDSNGNFWRALASLPKTITAGEWIPSCCVVWHDKIFVYGCDERYVEVCYMYEPPPKQANTIGTWTTIETSETSYLQNAEDINSAFCFEI